MLRFFGAVFRSRSSLVKYGWLSLLEELKHGIVFVVVYNNT